ncbi:MAG TPA: DUF3471 domain-containing protein, partial [Sediminibacterium sp.]|nr:DUF3471 domain-containing protein [Sediminibacterium sp.]
YQRQLQQSAQEMKALQDRVKGGRPALPLTAYTGNYDHPLYGSITITTDGKDLQIHFNGHRNLTARLEYMDKGEWRMQYSNPAYGTFATKFNITDAQVRSVLIKANDFVEYDPYIFTKE